jgi:hypothetical protein
MDSPITGYEHYAQKPNVDLRVYRPFCLMWQRLSQVFCQASTTLIAKFAVSEAVGAVCSGCVQFARRLNTQRAI